MLNQASNAAAAAQQYAAAAAIPSRPLERISTEADRLSRLAFAIQSFLDRFHGNPQAALAGAQAAAPAPIQIGYRNEIDRLSANVDVLDNLVQALGEAG